MSSQITSPTKFFIEIERCQDVHPITLRVTNYINVKALPKVALDTDVINEMLTKLKYKPKSQLEVLSMVPAPVVILAASFWVRDIRKIHFSKDHISDILLNTDRFCTGSLIKDSTVKFYIHEKVDSKEFIKQMEFLNSGFQNNSIPIINVDVDQSKIIDGCFSGLHGFAKQSLSFIHQFVASSIKLND